MPLEHEEQIKKLYKRIKKLYKPFKIESAEDEKKVLKLKRKEIIGSLTEEECKILEQNPENKKGFNVWLDENLNKSRLYAPDNPE